MADEHSTFDKTDTVFILSEWDFFSKMREGRKLQKVLKKIIRSFIRIMRRNCVYARWVTTLSLKNVPKSVVL